MTGGAVPFGPLASPWGRRFLGAALLVGIVAGVLATVDPLVSVRSDWQIAGHRVLEVFPYLLSLAVALAALGTVLLAGQRDRLWPMRYEIAVVLVMFTSHMIALGKGPLNPLTVAIGLLAAVWLFDRVAEPAQPWRPGGFVFLVASFFLLTLFSFLGHSFGDILPGFLATAPKLMLCVLLVLVLDNRPIVRLAIWALLWSAGMAGVVGIIQALAYWLFKIRLTLTWDTYAFSGSLLRAAGFSRFANQFSPPLVVAALIAVTLLASPGGAGRRVRLALLSVVVVAGIALSVVRGSWLALACGLAVLPFILNPRAWFHWLALDVLLGIVGLATGFVPWFLRTMGRMAESSLADRQLLFGAGLQAMVDRPWDGVGILNFGSISPTLEQYPVHNAVIQAGSELGIPAMLVFVALFLWVGVRLGWAAHRSRDVLVRCELLALLAGLVGLVVQIQGEPMAYSQFVWIYLAVGEAAARLSLGPAPAGVARGI